MLRVLPCISDVKADIIAVTSSCREIYQSSSDHEVARSLGPSTLSSESKLN